MPIRLNVVLTQPAAGEARDQALADALVARLLGRPALDVALVGGLDAMSPNSTDQLMLAGLNGDFAIVAWNDPATTLDRLRELGIQGRRAAHRDDPAVPQDAGRRIYCFDGRRYSAADDLIDALAALLQQRQVVTFGLGGPPPRPATAATPSIAPAVSAPPAAAGNGARPSNDIGADSPGRSRSHATAANESTRGEPAHHDEGRRDDARHDEGRRDEGRQEDPRHDDARREREPTVHSGPQRGGGPSSACETAAAGRGDALDALVDDLNALDL